MSNSSRNIAIVLAGLAALGIFYGLGLMQGASLSPSASPFPSYQSGTEAGQMEPCRNPKGLAESDLCAQWQAASAAADGVFWTKVGVLVGAAGSLLLLWQIVLTRKAVTDTSSATKAMLEANEISRQSQAAQFRAYVQVESIIYGDGEPIGMPGNYVYVKIRNVGTVPANIKSIEMLCWSVRSPNMDHHIVLIQETSEKESALLANSGATVPFKINLEKIPLGDKIGVVLQGKINYADRFSANRRTTFHYAIANQMRVTELTNGTRFTMANSWIDDT